MRRKALLLTAAIACTVCLAGWLAGCGKYGPPVRSLPPEPPATTAGQPAAADPAVAPAPADGTGEPSGAAESATPEFDEGAAP